MPYWHEFVLGKGREGFVLGRPYLYWLGICRWTIYSWLKIVFKVLKYISGGWLVVSPFPDFHEAAFLCHKWQDHPTAASAPPSPTTCLSGSERKRSSGPTAVAGPAPLLPFQDSISTVYRALTFVHLELTAGQADDYSGVFLIYFFNKEKGWTWNVNIQPGVETFQKLWKLIFVMSNLENIC